MYSIDRAPFDPTIPPTPLDSTLFEVEDEVFCPPLLTDFKANFSQSSPYNKYCFTPDGKQSVTGCAPLAIGTIIGKYRMVESLEGYSFDWNAMDNDAKHDGWSRLFEILGRPKYLNTQYKEGSASTSKYNYVYTFQKIGKIYTNMESFTPALLAGQLRSYVATLVRGASPDGGHIWIVDGGYIDKSGPVCLDPNEPPKYMFHCVWGWGGKNNGYFKYTNTSLGGSDIYPTFSDMEIIYGYK